MAITPNCDHALVDKKPETSIAVDSPTDMFLLHDDYLRRLAARRERCYPVEKVPITVILKNTWRTESDLITAKT